MDERILEWAEEFAQRVRRQGMEAAVAALKSEFHPDFDGEHCVDCGIELHPVRLKLQRVRCTDCQTVQEKHHGA
jgi:hypothetical protein